MVLEYCIDKRLSITAQFGKLSVKSNMFLQISLEQTFALVEPHINYDLTHFDFIKNDLVNWRGQNQEHHAFDEGSLNFVHSKTSMEVVKIYDAIRMLECQLFTARKKHSAQALQVELEAKIEWHRQKLPGYAKAPPAVQQERRAVLEALERRADELAEELQFIERCLASIAFRDDTSRPPGEPPSAANTDDALVAEG